MNHNTFKITVKFTLLGDTKKEFLDEYIRQCCNRMYQQCVEAGEILTAYLRSNHYITYMSLMTKDYGVPQVGVDLVAAWIEIIYRNCEGFAIEAIIVHPKSDPPALGAVIKWDYVNDCPIIKAID